MKIGSKVIKKSGKPFKSSFKVATIKSFEINKQDPKLLMGAKFDQFVPIVMACMDCEHHHKIKPLVDEIV